MSASALIATIPAQGSFFVRIGGAVVTSSVPVTGDGVTAMTFSQSGEGGPGRAMFTIEDNYSTPTLLEGAAVEIIDRRTGSDVTLFAGHLVETSLVRRGAGVGRYINCTAVGYDAWLDWRIIPRWRTASNIQKRINAIDTDRGMVMFLIDRFGGAVTTTAATVAATNASMPNVSVLGMTLREALQRIADGATTRSDTATRFFYVDNHKRLHYYRDTENLPAPYRIGEGSYVGDVRATAGLVSMWPMREATDATAADVTGYATGTLAGGYTRGLDGAVSLEPQLTATALNGTTGYMSATGAALHPGDTFTVEMWFRRATFGTAQALWSGGTGDVEIGFDAANKVLISKEGTGANFTSTPAYTDTAWHHLAVTRTPGTTLVYIDGSTVAGTTVAQTFVAGSGTIEVGRRKSGTDRYAGAAIQMVAVYSTTLSAATVLARYHDGVSVAPDEITLTRAAYDGREAVYVLGSNVAGSGWVRAGKNGINIQRRTLFGSPDGAPERQAFLERDDSETADKLDKYGAAFLATNSDPIVSGSFTTTGFDGWAPGQLVYITSTPLGLTAYPAEIKEVTTDVLFGSGVMRHDVQFGRARVRATRRIGRKR